MEILALLLRLIIAGTFFVAGISKLRDLAGTRKAVRDFGVPEWAAGPFKIALPTVELAIAVLLIPTTTAAWSGLSAAALLLIFIAAISINLAHGRKPECNCFGQLHSKPIGWPTLVRNCVLLAAAGFVLWEGLTGESISLIAWPGRLSASQLVGLVLVIVGFTVVAAQSWIVFHLLRQNGRLLLRMDALELRSIGAGLGSLPAAAQVGLALGSQAPVFELPSLFDSTLISLATLLSGGRPVVLIFSDPDCGPCSALLPDVAGWEQEHASTLTIALISRGSKKANRAKIPAHRIENVLLQQDREVAIAYQVNGTPGAVLIGVDGTIQSFVAMGSQAIAGLIAAAGKPPVLAHLRNGRNGNPTSHPVAPLELEIGMPAPPLRSPDLNGEIVDLASPGRGETLVLFWNPTCGYCSKMLPDLKSWEERRPPNAPQLLVVSSGSVEMNREMGLRASVVLDNNFAIGSAFHVRGTPGAVLVDEKGKIASKVASGAPAVFELANAHRMPV